MQIIYSEKCLEYGQPGHPESAERVRSSAELLARTYQLTEPLAADENLVLEVHSVEHFNQVRSGEFMDWDSPAYPQIFTYATLSAAAAVMAAKTALDGEVAFSLMRPPGHHAGRDSIMGFCYFNNIAVAVQSVSEEVDRIAIIDFDCHHGNGTESIVLGNNQILYVSLHQSPLFPGTGLRSRENCLNFPLPAGTAESEYLDTFSTALRKVADFGPGLVAVSAGFDSFKDDPITDMNLDIGSFEKIGREIAGLGCPTFSVLEGGYASALGECISAYLKGLEP